MLLRLRLFLLRINTLTRLWYWKSPKSIISHIIQLNYRQFSLFQWETDSSLSAQFGIIVLCIFVSSLLELFFLQLNTFRYELIEQFNRSFSSGMKTWRQRGIHIYCLIFCYRQKSTFRLCTLLNLAFKLLKSH